MNDSIMVTEPELHLQDEAALAVQRGLELLAIEDPVAWQEALVCFDRALELRNWQPLDDPPWHRWGVTAAMMNRADALHRLGRHEASLEAYDEALAQLKILPLDREVAFRWRLGLAWSNRAQPLQALNRLEESGQSLKCAIEVLDHWQLVSLRDRGALGAAWMNLARLRLLQDDPATALQSASQALRILAPFERHDPAVVAVTLQARHVCCKAVALFLEAGYPDVGQAEAWIHDATDWVESSLDLALFWQSRDFGDLPLQLFQFGCRIYLAYQPHFLGEFLLDVLRPMPRRQLAYFHAAEEVLTTAASVLRQRGPADLGLRRLECLLALLQQLEAAAKIIRSWNRGEATSGCP